MNHCNRVRGFTLIELMLAMGFVSALLIAISMTVIQIGNIYRRGITLKEVNQAGQLLSSEFQNRISENAPFDVAVNGEHYVVQKNLSGAVVGGRLCLGQYSYIWNYGSVVIDGSTTLSPNKYSGVDVNTQLRFIKVLDPSSAYCINTTTPPGFIYKGVAKADATELLVADSKQLDLAVHGFSISSSSTALDLKTGQQLYNIEFLLGTNETAAISSNTCKPPSNVQSNQNYCSINQFNIVARAGNKIK